ncbi:hypothetical protein E3Q19_03388 [Wallemia mellicola]|nr:hypothetical protein E3Q19_03388 [Wallemia mellicola]TIC73174.1 hypothetical protein E3Q00_03243 [Wallemia mellicola]
MNKRKIEDALTRLDKAFQSEDSVKAESSKRTKKPKIPAELEERLRWFTMTHNLQLRRSKSTDLLKKKEQSDLFSFHNFILRLQSFSLRTYTSKPIELSPPAVALRGWQHDEAHRNRILCSRCKVGFIVDLSAYQKLIDTYVEAIESKHTSHCPWKYQQCASSTYRIHELSLPPNLAANVIAERARKIDSNLNFSIRVKHPLSNEQVQSLFNAMPEPKPSEDATILAIYGWEYKSKISSSSYLLTSELDVANVSVKPEKVFDVVREHRFYAPQLMPANEGSKNTGVEALLALITRRGRKKEIQESMIVNSVSVGSNTATVSLLI